MSPEQMRSVYQRLTCRISLLQGIALGGTSKSEVIELINANVDTASEELKAICMKCNELADSETRLRHQLEMTREVK